MQIAGPKPRPASGKAEGNKLLAPDRAAHDWYRFVLSFPPHLVREYLERFAIDGVEYEAFNTSGGLGTLCETLEGKVNELNYKTVRYPGHHYLMDFLKSHDIDN